MAKVTYTNWNSGEPSNNPKRVQENAVHTNHELHKGLGLWNNESMELKFKFVCTYDLSAEWNIVADGVGCWAKCGYKGGSCDFCKQGSQKGYCCRKDGRSNGDCPTSALRFTPRHHTCVSQAQAATTTIVLRSGGVIDGIYIQSGSFQKTFGFCEAYKCRGSLAQQIVLPADETVGFITYGRSTRSSYKNLPCNISFYTNKRTYGPYSKAECATAETGGKTYHVSVPSELNIIDFFNSNVKLKSTRHESGIWYYFFDGFNSEIVENQS